MKLLGSSTEILRSTPGNQWLTPGHIFYSPRNEDSRLKWPVKVILVHTDTFVPCVTGYLLVIKEVQNVCAGGTSLLPQECGVWGDIHKLECTKQGTENQGSRHGPRCKAGNPSVASPTEVYTASAPIISREATALPDRLCCWLAADARIKSSLSPPFIPREFRHSQDSRVKASESSGPSCLSWWGFLPSFKTQCLDL